jgi:hypothetical protein
MLNDIMRENTVKDRLEELKMLFQSDSGYYVSDGRFENKEGWFGRKNVVNETENTDTQVKQKKLPLLTAEGTEKLIDLTKYVVLYAWREWGRALNGMDRLFICELRCYYLPINEIHYIKSEVDYGQQECEYSETGRDRYNQMLHEYKVISQKIDLHINEKIIEIREYKDGRQRLWQFRMNEWSDITPPDYYDV